LISSILAVLVDDFVGMFLNFTSSSVVSIDLDLSPECALNFDPNLILDLLDLLLNLYLLNLSSSLESESEPEPELLLVLLELDIDSLIKVD